MNKLTPTSSWSHFPAVRGDAEVISRLVEEEEMSLWDYGRVIRRRLRLIILFFLSTLLAIVFIMLMMTPVYTAETTLLIERNAPRVLDIREMQVEAPAQQDEYDFYKTQYEILKSRTLATWVIREQKLETNRYFSNEGREEGRVAKLWAQAKTWMTKQAWTQQLFSFPPEDSGENLLGPKSVLIESYMSMLEITPVQRTRLVKIIFHTPDPVLSARLANAHAQAYIQKGLGLRVRANEEAQRFLQEKLVELKGRLEQSEVAIKHYRQQKKMISLEEKENLMNERLSDLNRRLTEAEVDRIGLEAQLYVIRKNEHEALSAISSNPTAQALKLQLAQDEREIAQLSVLLQPGHPRIRGIKIQVEETRSKLREEIRKLTKEIEATYLAAVLKEEGLRGEMEDQKTESLGVKDAAVQYTILAREVDTNRQLYDSILQRMKEMGVSAELRTSNISIIDSALPPLKPSFPQKKNLFLGALMGLIGGIGLALGLEYLDNTLKTLKEAEHYLRLSPLGVVPDFPSAHKLKQVLQRPTSMSFQTPPSLASGERLALVSSYHPRASVITEAYRTLRSSILLSRAGGPPKTLLFTSGSHGEGKTVTVVNTAIVFAQTGVRVLLIDADLRRPACHKLLGFENGRGLTELLTGQRMLEEVIESTPLKHLCATGRFSLLRAGSFPPDPAELVGSKKMQEILCILEERYDYILIDSPPLLPVSDTVLLSTMVDGVVLVVDSQATSKYLVKEARSRLDYARATILGVVLNRVNLQRRELYQSSSDA